MSAELARLAAAGPRGRRGDHRRRPDPLPAARGRRRRDAAPCSCCSATTTTASRWPAAAHRARPPHALPPRPGLLPGRLDRPRRDRGAGGPARGGGGDRPRPGRGRGLRRAARAVAAAEQLRRHAGARLVARAAPVTVVDPDEVHAIHLVPITELLDRDHRIDVRHPSGLGRARRSSSVPTATSSCGGSPRASSRRLFDYLGWATPWDEHECVTCRPTCCRVIPAGPPGRPPTASSRSARVNLLDWLLVALVLAYALSGYWQGFVTGAFATAGLLLGGLIGVWLAPIALGDANPSLLVSLGALFIVILSRVAGPGGVPVRRRPAPRPDHAGSPSAPSTPSAAPRSARWPCCSSPGRSGVAIAGSGIWRDHADGPRVGGAGPRSTRRCPTSADGVLQAFNNVVGTTFFPRYLEPFAPERIVEVAPGPKRLLTRPRRGATPRRAWSRSASTNACGRGVEGSGFLYAARPGDDQRPRRGRRRRPEVEIGDSSVAGRRRLLRPRPRRRGARRRRRATRRRCAFDQTAEAEDGVAILGYPQDGPYDVQAGRVRSEQRLRSPEHLRRGHRHPRGVLAARAGPAGQLRRPDRVVGRRRRRAWCSPRR